MIALLRGEVAVRRADHVVVMCGHVGYRAAVSAETLRHVPPAGEQVTLHTHLIVRDDALALYGFHSEQERELFLMLLGVQAVGPKVALGGALGGAAPRAARGAGGGGRGALPGGSGDRQAHRRADHRRAAREGRGRQRRAAPRAPRRSSPAAARSSTRGRSPAPA